MLAGGGIPFFPQAERRVYRELVETRTFSSRVVYLRYRVQGGWGCCESPELAQRYRTGG